MCGWRTRQRRSISLAICLSSFRRGEDGREEGVGWRGNDSAGQSVSQGGISFTPSFAHPLIRSLVHLFPHSFARALTQLPAVSLNILMAQGYPYTCALKTRQLAPFPIR